MFRLNKLDLSKALTRIVAAMPKPAQVEFREQIQGFA
jgi:hypothetical protein